MFFDQLNQALDKYHLLKHPFYKAWSAGTLNMNTLKDYSCQYYHHVEAFPRYLSTIHSKCSDIKNRQILLDNLIDEEKGDENHPQLWLNFAKGCGANENAVKSVALNQNTNDLIEGFFELCNHSYAKGLGALYAYERQVPEVAKSKIQGLEKFYDIIDEKFTKFFTVHMTADVWHSQEVFNLINELNDFQKDEAKQASVEAAKLLWKFLDGFKIDDSNSIN